MQKDFREFIKDDLRNLEFQQAFVATMYEEDGADGVIAALQEMARAKPCAPQIADSSFKTVRSVSERVGHGFCHCSKGGNPFALKHSLRTPI